MHLKVCKKRPELLLPPLLFYINRIENIPYIIKQ